MKRTPQRGSMRTSIAMLASTCELVWPSPLTLGILGNRFVATDDSLRGRGGLYINHDQTVTEASAEARDPAVAARLWDSTCAVIGVKPDFVATGGAPAQSAAGSGTVARPGAGYGAVSTGAGAAAGAGTSV